MTDATPKELADHITKALEWGIASSPVLDMMYQNVLSKHTEEYLQQVNKYLKISFAGVPMKITYDKESDFYWLVIK